LLPNLTIPLLSIQEAYVRLQHTVVILPVEAIFRITQKQQKLLILLNNFIGMADGTPNALNAGLDRKPTAIITASQPIVFCRDSIAASHKLPRLQLKTTHELFL
jgi:hypothetical protein